jgi:hypothetical protein
MPIYEIYYMKPFKAHLCADKSLTATKALDPHKPTHVFLMRIEAENLDGLFHYMQGENWSPNGEARPLIISRGLGHTSMSVGDIIHDVGANHYHQVDFVGFHRMKFS